MLLPFPWPLLLLQVVSILAARGLVPHYDPIFFGARFWVVQPATFPRLRPSRSTFYNTITNWINNDRQTMGQQRHVREMLNGQRDYVRLIGWPFMAGGEKELSKSSLC